MDNYIVSARKYRPATFRSVVGQRSLTTTLKNAIHTNKLAHAYLFCGPRGVGKTSCARIFAKTINCLNLTADGEACNACESCMAFNEQRSYNIHELDAASNNSVDDIRSLIDQVRIPPPIGRYKVFIIDEVHMLSSAAFNAFLKTLEEPPHHALFILATTEKQKVLPTILSRCQIYDFSRISIADMVDHLQYVASCEGVTAEPEALNVIAQKADGGMRDALSIFDQVVSFTGGIITYQAVIDNLNVLDYEYYFRLTDAMLAGNVRASVIILNDILNKGFDGQNIVGGLASHFRDLLVCRDEATMVLFEVGASIRARYVEMAKRCPDQLLFKAIELANSCDLNYRASRNKRLLMELLLIQLCQLSNVGQAADENKKKTLIEPIPASLSEPNAPVQNASVQNTPVQAATQSVHASIGAVVSSSSAPSSIQMPSATSPKKNSRPPMTTSLKDIGLEKPQESGEAQQSASTSSRIVETPFTEEQLLSCWNAFVDRVGEKVYLKNILINCKPMLQENFFFEVGVHNPVQEEELVNGSYELLNYLRSELKNTQIQMRVRIIESNEKHLAYLPSEKYDLLMTINPILARLKDEFNLMMD
ncbi:MAG: DNA polymerase III subunit gamma/tau [Tannerellaceae bacterium]